MAKEPLRCTVSLRIFCQEKCFGPGIADLLELVRVKRSLRAATMQMDMSYSKAWAIIKRAEEQFGFKLLKSATGGRGGGSAELTAEAEALLAEYRSFEEESKAAVEELFQKHFSGYLP